MTGRRTAHIDPHRCDRSPACPAARVCPVGAITPPGPGRSSVVDPAKCIGCGKCLRFCPGRAITLN